MPSRAATSSFAIGDQSVVQVWAGNNSEVTIRAWPRPTIEFDTDDEAVQVLRHPVTFGTVSNPLSVTIPLQNVKIRDPQTGAIVDATLPPEDFPYAADFRPGVHDTVRIITGEGSHLTVMVPPSTAILDVRVRGLGAVVLDGYHGGTLFVASPAARMNLSNLSTAAFIQNNRGRLEVDNSSFDRLRSRAVGGTQVYQHDRGRQVEVSSLGGAIVWDDGTFDPGLARFESASGPIGIGVDGAATVQARSGDGHVFGLWDRRTPLDVLGDNQVNATIDGGGPVVTAVSTHGDIFLYDGSLATRRVVPPDWRRLAFVLRGPVGLPFGGEAPVGTYPPPPLPRYTEPAAFDRFGQLRGN